MRIGYLTGRTNCSLTDYESYESCSDKELIEYHVDILTELSAQYETIEFVEFNKLSPSNWYGPKINESLLGALSQGLIDVVGTTLMSESRAQFIAFTTPHLYDKICFYIRRPHVHKVVHNPWYFLKRFSTLVWIFALVSILTAVIVRKLIKSKIRGRENLRCFNHRVIVVGMFCAIYISTLRAAMTETGHLEETFSTISDLASLVQSKERTLIAENINFTVFPRIISTQLYKVIAPLKQSLRDFRVSVYVI